MSHPNRAEAITVCTLIALSILGVLSSIDIGTTGGAIVWSTVGMGAGSYLIAGRCRRDSDVDTENGDRAECE